MDFILSDATPDRFGDIVEPSGWDLTNFKRNPICLFNHDKNFIVGSWDDVRVSGGALKGRLRLLPKGTSSRINEIRQLVEVGVLRATSVGFKPIESEPIYGSKGTGTRYTKSELMEVSLVSIPANPACLAIGRSLKLSDEVMDLMFISRKWK